jgi:probable rRNA maturation factor
MASRRRPTARETVVRVRSEHASGAWAVRVLRAAGRTFAAEVGGGELSILVVGDRAIRKLNRDWRQKDEATDVLSFEQPGQDGLLGDVVLSLDTARRQAKEGGRPLSQQLARLLAHGVLHLAGHDHLKPDEARRMAAAEVKLLGTVGLVGEALDHPQELAFRRARTGAAS